MVQLESWVSGSEGVVCEGVITCGAAAGASGAGAAEATLGDRYGATLGGWKRGCMGLVEERVCH